MPLSCSTFGLDEVFNLSECFLRLSTIALVDWFPIASLTTALIQPQFPVEQFDGEERLLTVSWKICGY